MKCNFDCKYCYEDDKKQNLFMDKKTADNLIQFVISESTNKKTSEIQVSFHGGEPLLNFDIIRYIVSKLNNSKDLNNITIHYGMTTNGYLLNDEKIDFINSYIDNVSVSLDGKRQTNDLYRLDKKGQGTYNVVVKNAEKLLLLKPDINVRMTINADTICDLYGNIKHLVELGYKNIIPVINIWDKKWSEEKLAALNSINKTVEQYALNSKKDNIDISLPISREIKSSSCDGGSHSFSIDPIGNIYPCTISVGNPEICCGNVVDGLNKEIVINIKNINNMVIEDCVGCNNYNCCPTVRCKFVNKKFTGRYDCPIPIICYIQNIKLLHKS